MRRFLEGLGFVVPVPGLERGEIAGDARLEASNMLDYQRNGNERQIRG